MVISAAVLNRITGTVGALRAEHGGVLGGHRSDGIVREFHFDITAKRSSATYSPDVDSIRHLCDTDWNPRGINILGFVHSHPPGLRRPSGGDLAYAERILAANPLLDRLLLPIVIAVPDVGHVEFIPYAAYRLDQGSIEIKPLELLVHFGQRWTTRSAINTIAKQDADRRCTSIVRTPDRTATDGSRI